MLSSRDSEKINENEAENETDNEAKNASNAPNEENAQKYSIQPLYNREVHALSTSQDKKLLSEFLCFL